MQVALLKVGGDGGEELLKVARLIVFAKVKALPVQTAHVALEELLAINILHRHLAVVHPLEDL